MRWILGTLVFLACNHVPPPPIDCASQPACKATGECTYDPTMHACRARGDDCAESEACRTHGACTADIGRCRVRSDMDCARGEVPRREGRSVYVAMAVKDCMRPVSDEVRAAADCWGTTACHHDGLCRKRGDVCRAADPEHCRASLRCAQWGRCTLRGEECIATSRRDCDHGSQTRGFQVKYGVCYDPLAPALDPATLPSTAPDVEEPADQ